MNNLINFWLSLEFSTLTGVSLTILAVLFTCIYTSRTSAEANMHNANANFLANVRDKRIREIWLEDSFAWRDFCAINTKIATMFLYSFILLAITFFITLIVQFIKKQLEIPLKLEIGFFMIIIILTFFSVLYIREGFLCYGESGIKLYKSKEESRLTKFSRREFKNGLLNYKCSPRFLIFNEEAKEIYHEYEQYLSKRTYNENETEPETET